MLKLCWLVSDVLFGRRGQETYSERRPPEDHSNKVWSQFAKKFQRRGFLNIFPIGSYVKTMSAVLVGRWSYWIKKGDHLRTIPSKILSKFDKQFQEINTHFLLNFQFLAMAAIFIWGGVIGYNSERGPPKDHPCQVWSKLDQWFHWRRLKCES